MKVFVYLPGAIAYFPKHPFNEESSFQPRKMP